ncbi:MAG: hypothetical protein IPP79_13250 [Chitinophagaceae bacterium]|nr:hypothetical protein [Chitinophagaceae bacterium]
MENIAPYSPVWSKYLILTILDACPVWSKRPTLIILTAGASMCIDKSLRKIYYDENLKEVNDQYVKKGENVKGLPEDGLAGYVYVENVLEKIFLK